VDGEGHIFKEGLGSKALGDRRNGEDNTHVDTSMMDRKGGRR
jgi:hypothetical protein